MPKIFGSRWDNFSDSKRSNMPEHKVSGELHQGSNYTQPYLLNERPTVHTRRLLAELGPSDIESDEVIVDTAVRNLIRAKLRARRQS